MAVDRNGFEVLSRDECFALMDTATLGRVGLSIAALPVVLPVNYGLLGSDVVFRTVDGTKLASAASYAVVAFEVDAVTDRGEAWSVLVVGTSEIVRDPSERAAAERAIPTTVLADVPTHVVRVRAEIVTGRRVAIASPGGDDPGEAGTALGATLDRERPADFVGAHPEVP